MLVSYNPNIPVTHSSPFSMDSRPLITTLQATKDEKFKRPRPLHILGSSVDGHWHVGKVPSVRAQQYARAAHKKVLLDISADQPETHFFICPAHATDLTHTEVSLDSTPPRLSVPGWITYVCRLWLPPSLIPLASPKSPSARLDSLSNRWFYYLCISLTSFSSDGVWVESPIITSFLECFSK